MRGTPSEATNFYCALKKEFPGMPARILDSEMAKNSLADVISMSQVYQIFEAFSRGSAVASTIYRRAR